MSDYTAQQATAHRTLANHGASVTFTRTGTGTATSVAVSIKTNWQKFIAMGLTLSIPETLLVAGLGLTFAPQPGDTFVWAGATYAVVNVDTLAPNGTAILYTVVGNR